MRLHLCGTRGSTPAPGAEFTRYGGHTSCIALSGQDGRPRLLLDAGTGIRRVWDLLGRQPFRGSILLGHLHWDHTQGLPFFRAGDDPGARVDVHVPAQDDDPEALIAKAMSPPNFPIGPEQLRGSWRFAAIEEGQHEIEGFSVLACEIPHKGGRTFGYRISDGDVTVAYLSDHHPTSLGPGAEGNGLCHESALALAGGVDVLIHDAQYTKREFPERANFGHATPEYAIELARTAGARRLLLFHHDPARTDEELDALVSALPVTGIRVSAGRDGQVLDIPGRDASNGRGLQGDAGLRARLR